MRGRIRCQGSEWSSGQESSPRACLHISILCDSRRMQNVLDVTEMMAVEMEAAKHPPLRASADRASSQAGKGTHQLHLPNPLPPFTR